MAASGLNVFEVFAKIGADTSEFTASLDGCKSVLSTFSSGVGKAMSAVTSAIASGVKMASGKLVGFAKDAVQTGTTFDTAMANVAATLGKSVDEVQDLREFAKEMGETTRYSAVEAAQGLNYMALAGYDAAKSMEMLPKVMSLASAGAMDLAKASDMVTDAESALQLSSEQTTTLINQMAKTASSSNTNVAQLGEAILQIGGTAKDMAGGTLELTTVLGVLANNGMKGAEGGTHLRNMLNSLMKPSKNAKALMDEYNISLFDAQGNMKELNSVFMDLNKAFSTMTMQQRKTALTDLFNARDLKAAEALLASAGDAYVELQEKIRTADEESSASQMAKTQEDTLAGAQKLLESAKEGLKINFSEMITPFLTQFTNAKTKIVSELSASVKSIGAAFKSDGFFGLFKAFTEEFGKIKSKAFDYGTEVLDKILTSVAGNAKQIGEGAVKFISTFADKLSSNELLPKIAETAVAIIDGFGQGLTSEESINAFVEAAPKFLSGLANGIKNVLTGKDGEGGLLGSARNMLENISEWFADPNNRQAFEDGAEKLLTSLCKSITAVLDASKNLLLQAAKTFLDVFLGDIDYDHGAEEFWISFGKSLKKKASSLWQTVTGALIDAAGGYDEQNAIEEAYQHAGKGAREQFQEEWDAAVAEAERQGKSGLYASEAAYEYFMKQPKRDYWDTDEGKAQQAKLAEENEAEQKAKLKSLQNEIIWQESPLLQEKYKQYVQDHFVDGFTDLTTEDLVKYTEGLIANRRQELRQKNQISDFLKDTGTQGVPFAEGGIVTKPTLAWIGEKGEKEAVIPLEHETETTRAIGNSISNVVQNYLASTVSTASNATTSYMQDAYKVDVPAIRFDFAQIRDAILAAKNARVNPTEKAEFTMQDVIDKFHPVPFAEGGIVSKPTFALIGERGEREAVVPLEHETETSRAFGFGRESEPGITVQFGDIYVQGGTSPEIADNLIQQIDEKLRTWQIMQKRGVGSTAWQH